MTEYTPEKVAVEIATAQKAVWAEIHGQDANRNYSVAEVKRLVYSLDNAFSTAITALTAVSAERDDAIKEMHARELHHFEEEQISTNQAHNLRVLMAERDRLHTAITEARAEAMNPLYVQRILRAALEQKGNDDDR